MLASNVTRPRCIDWSDVWLSGLGSALIASLTSVLVALLVVWLTQRGDHDAERRRESWRAAEALPRQVNDLVAGAAEGIKLRRWNVFAKAFTDWQAELLVMLPVITDEQVAATLNAFNEFMHDLARDAAKVDGMESDGEWNEVEGDYVDARTFQGWREESVQALGIRYAYLGSVLAAHRAGKYLPAAPGVLPEAQTPWADAKPARR